MHWECSTTTLSALIISHQCTHDIPIQIISLYCHCTMISLMHWTHTHTHTHTHTMDKPECTVHMLSEWFVISILISLLSFEIFIIFQNVSVVVKWTISYNNHYPTVWITLYNVCAVHWKVWSVHWRLFTALGGDQQYTRVYWVHWGISAVGCSVHWGIWAWSVQFIADGISSVPWGCSTAILISPNAMSSPQCTNDIP